jgi:hypothetical protein
LIGCDGVFTDDPALAVDLRGQMKADKSLLRMSRALFCAVF